MEKQHKLSRRHFLHLSAVAAGSIVLSACGGSNEQANSGGSTNNTRTTGAKRTPTSQRLNFEGPSTEVATPTEAAGGGSTTTAGTPAIGGGQTTEVATQGPQPTPPVPKSFKESPQLTEMVKSGKLPKLSERLPKNPMVLHPAEKVGNYGGDWNYMIKPNDGAGLLITIGYENLVRWKPDTIAFSVDEVIPGVAESFDINKNGTEYTFKLREGMKWSDGHPFTADDIMFWFNDVLSNEDLTPSFPTWLTSNGKPVVVEKKGDYAVVFKFPSSSGLFLQNLSQPAGNAPTNYPAHYVKQFHKKYNPKVVQQAKQQNLESWTDLFLGKTSPWENPDMPVLHGWRVTNALGKSTERLVAERNPYYWKVDTEGNQLPYLDQVVYTIISDLQVMTLKALNGEIDFQTRYISTVQNKPVFYKNQDKGNYHFFSTIPDNMNAILIMLNLTAKDENLRKVFGNKDFRIGLSHAINRKDIIDVVLVQQGEPWQAAPSKESPFYNEKLAKQYTEYDVKKANEYLDKAVPKKDSQGRRLGPDGKSISFTVETASGASTGGVDTTQILDLVRKDWQAVGVSMQIKAESTDLMYERKAGNQHDAVTWGGNGGLSVLLDPRDYFPFSGESNFAIPWANWYNAGGLKGQISEKVLKQLNEPIIEPPSAAKEQMKLYDQIKATADSDKQTELMRQILRIAQEQFWTIGISSEPKGYGIVKTSFHNTPKQLLFSWPYPPPAPTNPCQYFTEDR